jgi:hypothetical protein
MEVRKRMIGVTSREDQNFRKNAQILRRDLVQMFPKFADCRYLA